jgi:hypothetical protein
MNFDPIVLRTSLIITLSILLLAIIAGRLRRRIYVASVPAPLHAKLISLEVAYHPSRLHLVVDLPARQLLRTSLLDQQHNVRYAWPEGQLEKGLHAFDRDLPPLADGIYFLELATPTQRTVRQFRLQ